MISEFKYAQSAITAVDSVANLQESFLVVQRFKKKFKQHEDCDFFYNKLIEEILNKQKLVRKKYFS